MDGKKDITIWSPDHVSYATQTARNFAEESGFSGNALDSIEESFHGLASAITRRSKPSKSLSFTRLKDCFFSGIEIEVVESTPEDQRAYHPPADLLFEKTIAAAANMADEIKMFTDILTNRVVIRKYLTEDSAQTPMRIGMAVRTHPGSTICGDGYAIKHCQGFSTFTVIDGLGHGLKARMPSEMIENYMNTTEMKSLQDTPELIHNLIRGTRGAVAAISHIDLSEQKLSYVGIGNISARLWIPSAKKWESLVSMQGTLGIRFRTPRVFYHPWEPNAMLVMHSDGIREHWDFNKKDILNPPSSIAYSILTDYWRKNDDATVLIVK